MKANDGSGNNELKDVWETPKGLFESLHKQYNFFIDCCASKENSKCHKYFNKFEDTNFVHGNITCWMNPPFSKAKEMFEHFFKIVTKGVAIYRCDNMETRIWQETIFPYVDWIFIPKGRINYEGMEGKGSRFPSALIGIGVEPPKSLEGTSLLSQEVNNGN